MATRTRTRVSRTDPVTSVKASDGAKIRPTPKLTNKEVIVRKIKKYATTTFGLNTRVAAGLGYSSGGTLDSQFGNFYSPQLSTDFLEKPQNLRERRAWYRHFYHSNEFVGQAIDLHSTLPLSKIRLEKPVGKNQEQIDYVYSFFVEMCDELKLFKTLIEISHEYWLLGNCAPKDMQVRTSEGFKTIDKVLVGDLVLTHRGRWKKVTKVCSRESEEDILRISVWNTFLPLRLTKEHPVEVFRNGSFVFVPAGDVTSKDFIKVTWPKNVVDVTSINILRKRNEKTAEARKVFASWIESLKDLIIRTRVEIFKDLGINLKTLNSLVFKIGHEIGKSFYKRIGAKGHQKESDVIWNPVTPGTINVKETYGVSRVNEHTAPTQLLVDNDFAYLVGYWLGDGALGIDYKRKEWGRGLWQICGANKSKDSLNRVEKILTDKFGSHNIKRWVSKGITYVKVNGNPCLNKWWADNFGRSYTDSRHKKVPQWFSDLPVEKLKHFLAGLVDSDGCSFHVEANNSVVVAISMVSKSLTDSIREISFKCGAVVDYTKIENVETTLPSTKKRYTIKTAYRLCCYDEKSCKIMLEYACKEVPRGYRFFGEKGGYKRVGDDVAFKVKSIDRDPGETVFNMEVEDDHTYQVNGFSTHNCHIYAEDHNPYEISGDNNEEKINELKAAGKMECDRLYKEFKIIDRDPNYKGWRKLIILPPDQVRIKKVPLSDESLVEFIPDPDTRKSILQSQDPDFYTTSNRDVQAKIPKIPNALVNQLRENGSLILDTDPFSGSHVYHLARKKSQYETMGVSILERCINTLLYDDKLRQAQTSIASRHMTPIRVVWADELSESDLENLREQVDMALVDPDYSIITNYEVHWQEMGSQGRIMDLTGEHEYIANCLFAGLGVTRELLTGEGTYAGNRITLEILNTQYLLFRELLQEYVENNLFKPVAKKKGFVEKDKYGRERLLYPRLSFTRLAIKDNEAFFEQAMQLYNKGSISIDVILEMLNIDPISTKAKIEADLFTVNDFAFNQLITNMYVAAGTKLVERYSVAEKIAEYLNLDSLPQPPPSGVDVGGLEGAPMPPMGRFSSTEMTKERNAALSKLIALAMANPKKLDEIAKFLAKK